MKKKIWLLILCAVLLIAVAQLLNTLYGNPFSKSKAQKTVESYLTEAYPTQTFAVEDVQFSMKSGGYDVLVRAPGSADIRFSVCVNARGKLVYDSYEEEVLSGKNTADRLSAAYAELAVPALKLLNLEYSVPHQGAYIAVTPVEESPVTPEFALLREELILDAQYDIKALAKRAGVLEVTATSKTVTPGQAAELLLSIRKAMDDADIPFRAVSLTLRQPPDDYGAPELAREIRVENFPYDQLFRDGLGQRITNAQGEKT